MSDVDELLGRPEAVLFDFGGVVVASPFTRFAELERDAGLPEGAIRAVNSRDPDTNAWARIERGEIDVDEFCREFEAEAGALGHRVDAHEVIEPILSLTAAEHRAVPEMVSAIRACREHGVRVALITNNVVPMRSSPDSDWIFATFDVVVESCVVGVRKPEPAVYRLALDALAVDPARAIMLDDLGINLKPARAIGMRTIKVADPVVAAAELVALLGQ